MTAQACSAMVLKPSSFPSSINTRFKAICFRGRFVKARRRAFRSKMLLRIWLSSRRSFVRLNLINGRHLESFSLWSVAGFRHYFPGTAPLWIMYNVASSVVYLVAIERMKLKISGGDLHPCLPENYTVFCYSFLFAQPH